MAETTTTADPAGPTAYSVDASLDNVRSLVTLLRAVHLKDSAQSHATFSAISWATYSFAPAVPADELDRPGGSSVAPPPDASAADPTAPLTAAAAVAAAAARGLARDATTTESTSDRDEHHKLIQYALSLDSLLECLCVFGGSSATPFVPATIAPAAGPGNAIAAAGFAGAHDGPPRAKDPIVSLRLQIQLDSPCLTLVLHDSGVITVCKIAVFEPEPLTDLDRPFRDRNVNCKIIMNSFWLRDALSELESTSEKISIHVSPTAPHFRLSASGLSGDAEMEYPKSVEVMQTFSCQTPATYEYQASLIQPALKSLSLSTKTSIRINTEGFMNMQFMVPISDNGGSSFVEFLCAPLAEE
ncbi:Rad1/Rec1/Rad17 [Zopfochytrium polystomum]|nr:Rad1/Rec1/Rad17 [Zopfochytrium polystomum]